MMIPPEPRRRRGRIRARRSSTIDDCAGFAHAEEKETPRSDILTDNSKYYDVQNAPDTGLSSRRTRTAT